MRKCLSLNVGSGNDDINGINVDIKRLNRDNYIISTGECLPFRDDSYPIVYCSHVLEHVANPIELCREMLRVSSDRVIIKTPHRLWKMFDFNKYHLVKGFSSSWFGRTFKNYRHKVFVKFGGHIISRPYEVMVIIEKYIKG